MYDLLERYRWLLVGLLATPLLVGAGFLLSERLADPSPLELNLNDLPDTEVRVYVTGAVQHPGVYPLEQGDRWIDGLEAAGGATDDADLAAVDLARRVHDEDTILVPHVGTVSVAPAVQGPLVDLNVAAADQLETLPGIGEVRAGRIVDSRQTDGPFTDPEQLVERELVPASVYEDIADMVTVGAVSGVTSP